MTFEERNPGSAASSALFEFSAQVFHEMFLKLQIICEKANSAFIINN